MVNRNKNGTFRTGHDGAKPVGSKNKITLATREKIQQFLDAYSIENMESDFKKITPRERLQLFLGLSEFVQPKLQRLSSDSIDSTHKIIVKVQEPPKRK